MSCKCGCTSTCAKNKCLASTKTVPVTDVDLMNADYTLTKLGTGALNVKSSPALTAAHGLTIPAGVYSLVLHGDASLGAFLATITTGSGTTITLAAGETKFANVTSTGVAVGF